MRARARSLAVNKWATTYLFGHHFIVVVRLHCAFASPSRAWKLHLQRWTKYLVRVGSIDIAYCMATTTDWSGIGFNYTRISLSTRQRMDGMDENDWRRGRATTVAIDQIQHFAGPTIRHSNHQTSYRRRHYRPPKKNDS